MKKLILLKILLRYNILMDKERNARPWDLFNKKIGRVSKTVADDRYSICKQCPHFFNPTKQCLKCGCLMTEKVKLSNAYCPLHKWEAEDQ